MKIQGRSLISSEPMPLTAADAENVKAVTVMLGMARNRQPHKREAFYCAAGQHLERLRYGKGVEVWAELVREHIGIGLSRAYELIAMGTNRLSMKDLRSRKGKWKASKRAQKHDSEMKSEA